MCRITIFVGFLYHHLWIIHATKLARQASRGQLDQPDKVRSEPVFLTPKCRQVSIAGAARIVFGLFFADAIGAARIVFC